MWEILQVGVIDTPTFAVSVRLYYWVIVAVMKPAEEAEPEAARKQTAENR